MTTETLCEKWSEIRELIEGEEVQLGPYFGHQLRNSPRHLLFTLSRYKFAARMLPFGKKISILEIGCSEGVGSLLLGEAGHKVLAIDVDPKAIECAKKTINKDNISFMYKDIMGNILGKFNAVVCLDVIEHIKPKQEQSFMDSIKANLDDKGMCIIGTPNDTATQYASKASQMGHINMYTNERFVKMMQEHFEHVFYFGVNDEVVHTGFPAMTHYLLAIGCGPKK